MKYLKHGAGALGLIIVLFVVLAPIGPLPGFFIRGTAAAVPAQWQDTSGLHEVQLRIGGGVPRVVIIWVVQVDNELYVVGANDSGWVSKLGDGGPVSLRIEGSTYELNATRLSSGQLPVVEAYQEKYRADYPDIVGGMGSADNMIAGAAVFRLSR